MWRSAVRNMSDGCFPAMDATACAQELRDSPLGLLVDADRDRSPSVEAADEALQASAYLIALGLHPAPALKFLRAVAPDPRGSTSLLLLSMIRPLRWFLLIGSLIALPDVLPVGAPSRR